MNTSLAYSQEIVTKNVQLFELLQLLGAPCKSNGVYAFLCVLLRARLVHCLTAEYRIPQLGDLPLRVALLLPVLRRKEHLSRTLLDDCVQPVYGINIVLHTVIFCLNFV